MKKFLSLFLALSMVFSLGTPALAVENGQYYEYSYNGLDFAIKYIIAESTIIEEIIITESGDKPITLKKIISTDGTIDVYQDDVQTNKLSGASYEQYSSVAQGNGKYIVNSSIASASTYASYGCGFNQDHMYVSSSQETVDIGAENTVKSIVAAIMGMFVHPAAGGALGIITAIILDAKDCGADYIDITETKYFLSNPYSNNMNCYHALYVYYNKTSSGGKSIINSEWVYTQELI